MPNQCLQQMVTAVTGHAGHGPHQPRPLLKQDVDMTSRVKSVLWHPSHFLIPGLFGFDFGRRRSQQITTVDPADIRGLATTLLWSVGCLPRSRYEHQVQALNVCEGCTITGAAPPPRRSMSALLQPVCSGHRVQRRLLGDRPGEGRHFPGDGHGDHVGMLAFGGQPPVPLAEPDLCLPTDVLDGLGDVLKPELQVSADLRRVSVGPGAFDEDTAGMAVTGFVDAAETAWDCRSA